MAHKVLAISHKRPMDMTDDELVNAFYVSYTHSYARYWYRNSVRLSVCPSVSHTPISYRNSL